MHRYSRRDRDGMAEEIQWLWDYLSLSRADMARDAARRYWRLFQTWAEQEDLELDPEVWDPEWPYDAIEAEADRLDGTTMERFMDAIADKREIHEDPDQPLYFCAVARRLLDEDEWLIHFTDDAYGIAHDGFTHGTDDMQALCLTTWKTHESKQRGGYNFAFTLHDYLRYGGERYGHEAVLFKADAAVLIYHYGDEENQVVFWGPSAHSIVPIEAPLISNCTDDVLIDSEDIRDVVDWVVDNFDEYKEHLSCQR